MPRPGPVLAVEELNGEILLLVDRDGVFETLAVFKDRGAVELFNEAFALAKMSAHAMGRLGI